LILFIDFLDRYKVEESSVCQAVVSWIKFNENSIIKQLPDLIQLIKFEKLYEYFCGDIVSNENFIK